MVGPSVVRREIKREYPLLHPVFNVSLLTKLELKAAVPL
jgi:hypothetical protein